MTRCVDRKAGFTLLEMLVASLLLGMLVTILTMVFNSSSIAWRTGKADIAQMNKVRYQMAAAQNTAENALPRVHPTDKQKVGNVLSPWDEDGNVRERAVNLIVSGSQFPDWHTHESAGSATPFKPWRVVDNIDAIQVGRADSFTVGVQSCGPDGIRDTADDINTWPDELEQ